MLSLLRKEIAVSPGPDAPGGSDDYQITVSGSAELGKGTSEPDRIAEADGQTTLKGFVSEPSAPDKYIITGEVESVSGAVEVKETSVMVAPLGWGAIGIAILMVIGLLSKMYSS